MIKTKVAKIVSPTRVVLAAGSEQGVREGMEFVIYEFGDEVKDPETNESLGKLELRKARVTITEVQGRFSVATTHARQVTRGPLSPFPHEYTETVYDTLPLDKSTATALAERQLTVKVGDLIRSVE